jgi:peptidase YpeB-like protein
MRKIASIAVVTAVAACSSSSERIVKLQEALAASEVSLAESIAVAEASLDGGQAVRASLLVDPQAVFAVRALGAGAAFDVRVDIVSSDVLSSTPLGESANTCPGSVSLQQAIAIAEAEVGGTAVLIQPDDDDACDREVQVLAGDTLWEVKVAPNGAVSEVEEADGEEEDD